MVLSIVEYLAVLLNVLYVVLAWRQNKLCWLFGAAGSALSVYYFQHEDIRLYSESFLYLFYVLVAIYGWWTWNQKGDEKKIVELADSQHFLVLLAGLLGGGLLFYYTSNYTDAARPWADSLSTVFGILATFLTIRKVLSSWVYWIVIDAFSVWLYWVRDSQVYAFQMILFTILALVGWMQWKKAYQSQKQNV